MEDFLLESGEWKEQTPAAAAARRKLLGNLEGALLQMSQLKLQTPAAAATPCNVLVQSAALATIATVVGIAYAGFVIYVTATYTHSWIEKLQMFPLCVVAITAPMLCTIMNSKSDVSNDDPKINISIGGICSAGFVIYVTATYTHSWIEKLQMIPLCIVAIMAQMLCTIMNSKSAVYNDDPKINISNGGICSCLLRMNGGKTDYAANGGGRTDYAANGAR